MEEKMFRDRRNIDRRQSSKNIKACRRACDRRSGTFENRPWWLKTNYCEHVLSPKLLIDNIKKARKKDSLPDGNSTKEKNHPKQA